MNGKCFCDESVGMVSLHWVSCLTLNFPIALQSDLYIYIRSKRSEWLQLTNGLNNAW